MPPQPQVSPVPHHSDGSHSTDEASDPSRCLKRNISDSDHRLKTAQNQARTEEALLQAQTTKRRRMETILQTQELEARFTERTEDNGTHVPEHAEEDA
jgi:hypothetical protein